MKKVIALLIVFVLYAAFAFAGEKARFIASDNGTVMDTRTKLMWAAKDNGSDLNWAIAVTHCENYRGGGYTDWRMPTKDELAGLYDEDISRQSAGSSQFPLRLTELIDLTACCVWAAETRGPMESALFDFTDGYPIWQLWSYSATYPGRALPVRSVK